MITTELVMTDKIEQIYSQLKKTLHHHAVKYYVEDNPEIPDAEYDRLMRQLQNIEAEYPDWVTVDSPSQRVGGPALENFRSVDHEIPMLSLDNAYSLYTPRFLYSLS